MLTGLIFLFFFMPDIPVMTGRSKGGIESEKQRKDDEVKKKLQTIHKIHKWEKIIVNYPKMN